ncbi:unnamed protein product [Blepharisma stoltei]|uniref:Palmitoyltransferase n=1 Tax=Blepharisma stoltei TaxID=1481888 RepID=A0AAU9IQC9_9CILI|nr:unnamed protein product [Blepharisma stoltei]
MPEGTFHCSTCETCILSMTQHCYFTNNCIGKQNFKYFYLFMIWVLIGSLFVCALLGQSFLRIFLKDEAFLNLIKDQKKIIVFTFVFCFALLFSVSILFGYYTYWSIDQRKKEFEIKSNKYLKLSQSSRGRVIAGIIFLKKCLLPFFEQERHAEDFSHVI